MPVRTEENTEVKTWPWQIWGRGEDSDNFSWLHHSTQKELQSGKKEEYPD